MSDEWIPWGSLAFVGTAIAVVFLRVSDRPLGAWEGVYAHYLPFWVLLAGAAITMVLLVRAYRVPWSIVAVFGWVYAGAIVAISLIWGLPYGVHDGWIHLRTVVAGQLAPSENAYPLFHVVVRLLVETTGQSPQWVITRMTVLGVTLGVLFSLIVVRRLQVGRTAQQTGLIVAVPALLAGFTPRPFSFALPFVLLFYWITLAGFPDPYQRRKRAVLVGVLALSTYLHSLIAAVMLIVGTSGWLVFGRRRLLHDYGREGTGFVVAAIAVAITTHFALVASIGERTITDLLARVLGGTTAEGGTSASQPTGSQQLLTDAFSNWSNFLELLSRSAYVLLLGTAVLVSVADIVRKREVDSDVVVTVLATGATGVALVLITIRTDSGVGIARLLALVPIVVLPAVIRGLRKQLTIGRETLVIALSVLLIVAGVFGAFQSSAAGGLELSAGPQQVTAIDWVVDRSPQTIVGTRMTFWIVEGKYGIDTSIRLSGPTNGTGVQVTTNQDASYAWNVTDDDSNALYMIDDAERHRAFQVAAEGQNQPAQCLRRFEREQSRIYENQDTSIYLRTRPASPNCDDVENDSGASA